MDVACGHENLLAVADPGAGSVYIIDLETGRWKASSWGGGEPLSSPVGISFQPDGSLLIVDSMRSAVFRVSDRPGESGVVVEGAPLVRPTSAAPLQDGLFLLVDSGGHALYLVERDGSLSNMGLDRGNAGQGLNFPVDVAVARDGTVYICDSLNAIVQKMHGSALEPLAGGPGIGGAGLVRPKGIALDEFGRLHVVDAAMQHVQVYDSTGALAGRYGFPGDGPGAFNLPAGICIDSEHQVFVADSMNQRVQVFRLLDALGGDD